MTILTWSNVCLRVWKEVIRTEGEKVELAYILIVEVVSSGKSNEERFIAVFSHELVELLTNVIHFNQQ
jgi:hypothetical protein